MELISKKLILTAFVGLILAFFSPQLTHASIFEGTITKDGKIGVCLGEPDLKVYPECKDVKCDESEFSASPLCTSEAEAGTGIAKNSLESTGITHTDNFGDFIKKLVNFSLPYLALAAFVGYVIAGFLYVTALGDEGQIEKAKNILIWSSIGLLLVILSYAITQLFTGTLVDQLGN